jgi:putative phage-type endonuclease
MAHQSHAFVQGSPEWLAHRYRHFNASEAAAMLGLDPHLSRAELLRLYALGDEQKFSDYVEQRVLARGHEVEAAARAWLEHQSGEQLYPITVSCEVDGLSLSASLDGITLLEDWVFECKSRNAALWEAVAEGGAIPGNYLPQLEQELLCSEAEVVYFVVSDGTNHRVAEYRSRPELRASLIAGWKQFRADVAAYVHTEESPPPVVEPVEALPVVRVEVKGSLAIISNLEAFGERLGAFVAKLNPKPATDEDFVIAEKAVKALKNAEDMLRQAEEMALSQTASVEELRSMTARLVEIARSNRLNTEKLVEARKKAIRSEQIERGAAAVREFVAEQNRGLGRPYLQAPTVDFAGAIKGLRTVASVKDAIDGRIAETKVSLAGQVATISANLRLLREKDEHSHLFPDVANICGKPVDDFAALVKSRIADHAERMRAEQERRDKEAQEAAERLAEQARELIREEERQRLQAEQDTQRHGSAAPAATGAVELRREPAQAAPGGGRQNFPEPAMAGPGPVSAPVPASHALSTREIQRLRISKILDCASDEFVLQVHDNVVARWEALGDTIDA